MSLIVNSSAGNTYFEIDGTAVTATTQPDVDSGAVAGVKATSIPDGRMDVYDPATQNPSTLEYSGATSIKCTSTSTTPADNQTNLADNQLKALRTVKTASAIRNDQWVQLSGVFFPTPSTGNDASATSLLSDNAGNRYTNTRVTFGGNVGAESTVEVK